MQEQQRLNSWKEIAAYLNVAVRTAQRWEKTERLPIRRHKHSALSSVFAYKPELEAWWNSRPDLRESAVTKTETTRSIAVLPFVDLSRSEADEILSDGLTEELINALCRIEGLRVIARTSVFHFKGRTDDVRSVAAQLGVRTVLEGSVRRHGERLRITAQLIDAADGCHLWSERYDRRSEDLLDLQEEIARSIAGALRVKLVSPAAARRSGADPSNYELYLEGRYHWNKRTPQGMLQAVRCFEQVLARDSRMAPAWAATAVCYSMLSAMGRIPVEESVRKAKTAAWKALEIDGNWGEAHTSLGFIAAQWEYDWELAENHFLRALALNPEHPNSHMLYAATVLGPTGRLDESERHLKRACELDPFSAVSTSALATHCVSMRQFDRAMSASRKALEFDPRYPWSLRALGQAYLFENRFKEAATEFLKIEEPAFAAGLLGTCYVRTGQDADARELLDGLQKADSSALRYQVAVLRLAMGDRDGALSSLMDACVARCMGVLWLKTDPIWDEVRPDPRFSMALQQMRLIPSERESQPAAFALLSSASP